jgi:hypothetical protein
MLIDTVPMYVQAMIAASADVGHPLSQAYLLSLVGLLGRELEARWCSISAALSRLCHSRARCGPASSRCCARVSR